MEYSGVEYVMLQRNWIARYYLEVAPLPMGKKYLAATDLFQEILPPSICSSCSLLLNFQTILSSPLCQMHLPEFVSEVMV